MSRLWWCQVLTSWWSCGSVAVIDIPLALKGGISVFGPFSRSCPHRLRDGAVEGWSEYACRTVLEIGCVLLLWSRVLERVLGVFPDECGESSVSVDRWLVVDVVKCSGEVGGEAQPCLLDHAKVYVVGGKHGCEM
eukprot:1387498-Amphidinium_carterae.1